MSGNNFQKPRGRNTTDFSISINLDEIVKGCDESKEALSDAVYKAAHDGGQLVYSAVHSVTPVGDKPLHWFYGRDGKYTKRQYQQGDLRKSIYIAKSKDNSGDFKASYHISWAYNGPRGVPYGFMVHNGTSRARANPFVINGYNLSHAQAGEVMEKVLSDALDSKGLFKK